MPSTSSLIRDAIAKGFRYRREAGTLRVAVQAVNWGRQYLEATSLYRSSFPSSQNRGQGPQPFQNSRRESSLGNTPLLSVVMPTYNTPLKWLHKCIASVRNQSYSNWQFCIADDASTQAEVCDALRQYVAEDPRIRVAFRKKNGHISAASNTALELAEGEYIVLLDHDDELHPDALRLVAESILKYNSPAILYSDEDLLSTNGTRKIPFFKPDWSPDLLRSMNYVSHLGVYDRKLVEQVGGFREGYEGSQDYDLVLRCSERVPGDSIVHIPQVLYHWRVIPGSASGSTDAKPYAYRAAERALNDHLQRIGWNAKIEGDDTLGSYRLRSTAPPPERVALVQWGEHVASPTAERLASKGIGFEFPSVVSAADQTTAERLNRAIDATQAEIICVVRDGLTAVGEEWLKDLAVHASQPHCGAVGPMVVSNRNAVVDCGLTLLDDGTPRVLTSLHPELPVAYRRVASTWNCAALSGRCLVFRRSVWEQSGGFDAEAFPNDLFAADWCCRLRKLGLFIAYNPAGRLKESRKRALVDICDSEELARFRERWAGGDPYRNPNLEPGRCDFRLRRPIRGRQVEPVKDRVVAPFPSEAL